MFTAALTGASLLRRLVPPPPGRVLLLSVQMGLELAVVKELEGLNIDNVSTRPCWPTRGFVAVTAPAELTDEVLFSLRSIHDILVYHTHFTLEACRPLAPTEPAPDDGSEIVLPDITAENVYTHLCRVLAGAPDLVPAMRTAASFRVTCSHSGKHSFTSKEIEFEAGGALQEGYKVTAQMRGSDVNVRVDVVGPDVVIATQLNKTELSRRHKTAFLNRVTIKSNIAFVMLQWGKFKPGDALLDPFCGSGTILLEAAETVGGKMTGVGCDSVAATVKGATGNAVIEGFENCLEFRKCNVVGLSRQFKPASFDLVVTNPPWGVQTGKNADLTDLYRKFLSGSWVVIKPGGYLVCFVLRAMLFLEIVRTFGQWRLVHSTAVKTRNNLPSIFVLERLESDELYSSIRQQLRDLGQFISIDGALFRKIHNGRDRPV
eukprot:m.101753 g.101753  ORF g.101753 m.101753 type:complete len:431 (-) comp20775_c0_seq1:187-1479(-)